MATWVTLHQAGLLSLTGILAAILVINRVLRTWPAAARTPDQPPRQPVALGSPSPELPEGPAIRARAGRRRLGRR